MIGPLVTRLSGDKQPGALADAIGSRVTGVQAGTVLAYLSGRVLGQYEVFSGDPGQLLLNAPNIVEVERKLGADPRDFRLWVCLHEVTHRTQFTAVPWMRGYFLGEVQAFVDASQGGEHILERLRRGVATLSDALRDPDSRSSVLDIVQTPAQKAVLDRLTALMTLLEGHAEFVMDGVGPEVIPTRRVDPGQVQPPPRERQPAGEGDPPAARHRGQDAAVRGGPQVRARRRRAGRHGRLQQDLRVAADPAPARRAGRPGRLGGPGARPHPRSADAVARIPAPVAAVRTAVRRALADLPGRTSLVLVACSGGADSLALAAAARFVAPGRVPVGLVTVDHGLQEGSDRAGPVGGGLGPRRRASTRSRSTPSRSPACPAARRRPPGPPATRP